MMFMPEHAHVFVDHLRVGAVRAGRSLAGLDLQAGRTVAFSDDLDRAIAPLKFALAYMLGAMGSSRQNFYNDAVRRAGYEDAALEVQRLWREARCREAARRVPDDLVLKTNLVGTEAMVRRRLEAYRRAGVTTLRVEAAGDTLEERLTTLGRLLDLVRDTRAAGEAAREPILTGAARA
jgi:alkanesulfonate monooxygenase SsuD/methylene tetrahydromethanopterin reductase-like flavin-dependent oxidoreductase (luciferase family)